MKRSIPMFSTLVLLLSLLSLCAPAQAQVWMDKMPDAERPVNQTGNITIKQRIVREATGQQSTTELTTETSPAIRNPKGAEVRLNRTNRSDPAIVLMQDPPVVASCQNTSETRSSTCATGFGQVQERRDYTCGANGSAGTWGSWYQTSNTCCDTSATRSRTVSCPAGYGGTGITEVSSMQCPAGVWSAYSEVSRVCSPVCTPSTVTTNVYDCPAGTTGYRVRTDSVTCPGGSTGAATNSTSYVSYCTPTCTPDTQTRSGVTACPAGYSGVITERNDKTCNGSSAAWSGWYQTSSTCAPTCDSSRYITQSRTCPAGQTGTITDRAYMQCPSGAWGTFSQYAATCTPTCTPDVESQYVYGSCPAGKKPAANGASAVQKRTKQCPAGTWSSWTTTDLCEWQCLSCGSSQSYTDLTYSAASAIAPVINACAGEQWTSVTSRPNTAIQSCNVSGAYNGVERVTTYGGYCGTLSCSPTCNTVPVQTPYQSYEQIGSNTVCTFQWGGGYWGGGNISCLGYVPPGTYGAGCYCSEQQPLYGFVTRYTTTYEQQCTPHPSNGVTGCVANSWTPPAGCSITGRYNDPATAVNSDVSYKCVRSPYTPPRGGTWISNTPSAIGDCGTCRDPDDYLFSGQRIAASCSTGSCTPKTEPYSIACNVRDSRYVSGTIQMERVTTCPTGPSGAPMVTERDVSQNCQLGTCTAGTAFQQTYQCAVIAADPMYAPLIGGAQNTVGEVTANLRTTCPSGPTGSTGSEFVSVASHNCRAPACMEQIENLPDVDCTTRGSQWISGTIKQIRSYNCTTNSWGPAQDTTNTCVSRCVPHDRIEDVACPVGSTGTAKSTTAITCNNGVEVTGNTTTDTSTCTAVSQCQPRTAAYTADNTQCSQAVSNSRGNWVTLSGGQSGEFFRGTYDLECPVGGGERYTLNVGASMTAHGVACAVPQQLCRPWYERQATASWEAPMEGLELIPGEGPPAGWSSRSVSLGIVRGSLLIGPNGASAGAAYHNFPQDYTVGTPDVRVERVTFDNGIKTTIYRVSLIAKKYIQSSQDGSQIDVGTLTAQETVRVNEQMLGNGTSFICGY